MKLKHITVTLWVLWICTLVGMVFYIDHHIQEKKYALRVEMYDKIGELFAGQDYDHRSGIIDNDYGYFFSAFNGKVIRNHHRVQMPTKPQTGDLFYQDRLNVWNRDYGDLASLYELNWGATYPNETDEGWNIIRICTLGTSDHIVINTIFPYKVGFKAYGNNYYTVEEAVHEAFDFFTRDRQSQIAVRFRGNTFDRFWAQILDCANEYYKLEKYDDGGWTSGVPIVNEDNQNTKRIHPYENGWMHNVFFRVFIAATQATHYRIQEIEGVADRDKKELLIRCGIIVSVVFLLLIIPLTIASRKSAKSKSQLATTLKTGLIPPEKMSELKERVNPQRFMEPYDADKVRIANELYARLMKDELTYSEFAEIEEEANKL